MLRVKTRYLVGFEPCPINKGKEITSQIRHRIKSYFSVDPFRGRHGRGKVLALQRGRVWVFWVVSPDHKIKSTAFRDPFLDLDQFFADFQLVGSVIIF